MKVFKKLLQSRSLFGSLAILVLWYILHLAIGSNIIPGPFETIVTFLHLMTGPLLLHILSSILRITVAIALSMGIGIPLGLWMGLSKRADSFISPIAYILYPIPKVAFLPLFMVLFGLGDTSKIILILSIIVFQIILAVRDGVKEIPQEYFYSVTTLGLNRRQVYGNLVFPAVLPKIMSALRVSIGVSIATLFFSENYATTYGIGYFIMNCWVMVDYVEMFAGILAMSLMGTFIFKAVDWAERKVCPWIRKDSAAA
jgi:NitT/TauT family transport system permease protein